MQDIAIIALAYISIMYLFFATLTFVVMTPLIFLYGYEDRLATRILKSLAYGVAMGLCWPYVVPQAVAILFGLSRR